MKAGLVTSIFEQEMRITVIMFAVLGVAFLYYWEKFGILTKIIMYVMATVAGVLMALQSILIPKDYEQQVQSHPSNSIMKQMFEDRVKQHQKLQRKKLDKLPPLMSRSVDAVISEILDFILRDFVSSWYNELVPESDITVSLKEEIWSVLETAKDYLSRIDGVKFFTTDIAKILLNHFQKLRFATSPSATQRVSFILSSDLATKKNEQEHLRKVTEFLLLLLLPDKYAKCQPVRHLLREIITCSVLCKLVDTICDPDYINLKLIAYLQWQQEEMEHHSRTYLYAATYEDFIRLIQQCTEIENLKHMRYCIVTEMMQSTAINNLKREKGIELEKDFSPQTTTKGDLLHARNLKRYINQLRYAKTQCEKRMKALGGPDYSSPTKENSLSPTSRQHVTVKVLSYSVIMESPFCRKYFARYLAKDDSHSLLGFWEAVEELKHASKTSWHELGNEIVQTYVSNSNSGLKLGKNILKGMESFMMANKGPEAFYQAQEEVYKSLEERFYAAFIVSDIYYKMMMDAEKGGLNFSHMSEIGDEKLDVEPEKLEVEPDACPESPPPEDIAEEDSPMSLSEHSNYVKTQLSQLQEKLVCKNQALSALYRTPKSDQKMIQLLENETYEMDKEIDQLECHITMTEAWINHLGQWKANIQNAEIKKENEKMTPHFTIVIYLGSEATVSDDLSKGWNVTKTVGAFHSLQQKLQLAASWLKKIELPSQNKPLFRTYDHHYINRATALLQNFLTLIMKDNDLNKNESLYAFLSPSPDHLKYHLQPRKKSIKFFLMQFFKHSQISGQSEGNDEDELLFLDDVDGKDDKKDSIAENLYALIGEIFEVKGVFSWLRKTLILIVQITFGKTINRQLRETVAWITSESVVLYCLQMFRDSLWPNGVLAESTGARTGDEKRHTRETAKDQLLSNIPEVLGNLVGQQNARKGMTKVFEGLQDKRLNKQLLHDILEVFLYNLVPGLAPAEQTLDQK